MGYLKNSHVKTFFFLRNVLLKQTSKQNKQANKSNVTYFNELLSPQVLEMVLRNFLVVLTIKLSRWHRLPSVYLLKMLLPAQKNAASFL